MSYLVEGPAFSVDRDEEGENDGKGKNDCIFLSKLRVRIFQMAGTVPGLPGVEYDGGGTGQGGRPRYRTQEKPRSRQV